MWRAFRFGGMFKGGRFVTERDVRNKIRKIDEYFDTAIVKNTFIPAVGADGSYDAKLAGLVFIEYDDTFDDGVLKALREMKIGTHSVVTQEHVNNIKDRFNKKYEQTIDIKHIEVGDVVIYSGMECMVNKIDGDNATVIDRKSVV